MFRVHPISFHQRSNNDSCFSSNKCSNNNIKLQQNQQPVQQAPPPQQAPLPQQVPQLQPLVPLQQLPPHMTMRQVNNRQDCIDMLPKSLRYDGSDSWKAFRQKFMRFAEVKKLETSRIKRLPGMVQLEEGKRIFCDGGDSEC